ncbi:PREDICTED: uncharacterized abhydrolase domain-containing protein DDB_G0269086-like isoform X2 [Cyprinodon variegatus]|uniref:uncharacterized abhydrolase domain-containing protein DDB_G0269086-like isoform X2 n=1 Tax=Cyprinodon variegatus TaxID=28743 RepID=UPI0007426532|nr:PREDICTED: uncharacterized abhydrolase domain-containing protein DDB_G0269086-like isoform X2 [Cyprinodon variegatus]
MTAKHRKGKSNHKQEDNFFKSEILETEVRPSGSNHTPLLVFVLVFVVGCFTGAWFFFQQHLTLTDLTDNVMGIQMKIAKLQSSHEELRLSYTKYAPENLETRLASLEESFALAQKQVGMALATAEQLKTSDLPAQVLSLHTEMKTRLAEVQQATVSLEQLSHLQSMLMGKSVEFEDVKMQVEGLASLSVELSQKVEDFSLNLAKVKSKMEKRIVQISKMSATLDGQTSEVLKLKNQLETFEAKLENSLLGTTDLRELLESKGHQLFLKASTMEQVVEKIKPPAEKLEKMEADAGKEKEVADDEANDYEEKGLSAADDDEGEEEELAGGGNEEEESVVVGDEQVDKAVMSEEQGEETTEPGENEEEAEEPVEQEEDAAEPVEQEEEAEEPRKQEKEATEPGEQEEQDAEHEEQEEEDAEHKEQEEEAAKHEEQEEVDVTEAEDHAAAVAAEEEEVLGAGPEEVNEEKTEEEVLTAAEEEWELSSKENPPASIQQKDYATGNKQEASLVNQEEREMEESPTEEELNETDQEKSFPVPESRKDHKENMGDDSNSIEENEGSPMFDEVMMDEEQELNTEEEQQEREQDELLEEFAVVENK